MGGHKRPAPAGWLVLATLPKGGRYVVMPPDGEPVDPAQATILADAVDWHSSVHAVGEPIQVWRATGWDPEVSEDEQYDLPTPREAPILEDEAKHPIALGPGASSQVFYLVDGQPFAGTARDYARAHALGRLDLVDVPEVVWTWQVVLTPDAPGGATWGWMDHPVGVTTTIEGGVSLRVVDELVRYQLGAAG